MVSDAAATRRIEITAVKPRLALYVGVRPTLVIEGRGQPIQWGVGTWQVPTDRASVLGVFHFNRLWRFGQAEVTLRPGHTAALEYRAPVLPFVPGRMRLVTK